MSYPELPGPCAPVPGDLLFQHTQDEPNLSAISRLFAGIHDFIINHVAVFVGDNEVIEASPPSVRRVGLHQFLANSHSDSFGDPRVMVCRVAGAGREIIDRVLERVYGQIGLPYNETYMPDTRSWYCSSLVQDAWRYACDGEDVFPETPLEFRDPQTGRIMPFWEAYYQERGLDIPQGQPGSHPALMSRSPRLDITGCYGLFMQEKR